VDKESVVTVVDMSTNGTFLNGKKMSKGETRPLKNGDKIALVQSVKGSLTQLLSWPLQKNPQSASFLR